MVDGNPKTQKALIKAGCKVSIYKGENISVFGGGGPTCLTRPMLRELYISSKNLLLNFYTSLYNDVWSFQGLILRHLL